jgi:hypothetical protein
MSLSNINDVLKNRDKELWAPLIAIAKCITDENLRAMVCNRLVKLAQERREEIEEEFFFSDWRIQIIFVTYAYMDEKNCSSDRYIVAEDLLKYIEPRVQTRYTLRKETIGRVLKDNNILTERKVKWIERGAKRLQKTCYLLNKQALAKLLGRYEKCIEPNNSDGEAQFYVRQIDRWKSKKRKEERKKKKLWEDEPL